MPERTYRYRLYPTAQQATDIMRTCSCARYLYNQLLADRTKHYRETRTWKKIDRSPYNALPFLVHIDPGALAWAEGSLHTAYKNFFRAERTLTDRYRPASLKKAKEDPEYVLMDTDLMHYPRFKKKKETKETYTTYIPELKIENERVLLPCIGKVKIRMHRPIPENAEQTSCTILKKSSGNYYLLIRLKLPEPKKRTDLETPLGIAFVPGKLAIRSDEEPVTFRHQEEKITKRIEMAKKTLRRRRPGSKGYEEARLYLARLYEHRVNQRKDDMHKAARQITNAADAIYVQQPDVRWHIKQLEGDKNAQMRLLDESRWTFAQSIKYKVQDAGKQFWIVPKKYPTYTMCSACGHREKEGIPEGAWQCPSCGVNLERNINAAINIENLAAKYIREKKEQRT